MDDVRVLRLRTFLAHVRSVVLLRMVISTVRLIEGLVLEDIVPEATVVEKVLAVVVLRLGVFAFAVHRRPVQVVPSCASLMLPLQNHSLLLV